MCSHVTRNNVSHNIDVPAPARTYTTYEMPLPLKYVYFLLLLYDPSPRIDWPPRIHRYAVASKEKYRSQLHGQGHSISSRNMSGMRIGERTSVSNSIQQTNIMLSPTHPMTQDNNSLWMPSPIIVSEQKDLYTRTYSLTYPPDKYTQCSPTLSW